MSRQEAMEQYGKGLKRERKTYKMDWLCQYVEGAIPGYDQLLPMARPIARFQGIYRDAIPPEKEDPIL